MLNRKYRANRTNIAEAIKNGSSIIGNIIYAKISPKGTEKPGFAIVISKKNEKTSVGRHKIKRKISSYIEKNLNKINPKFNKTIVFFVKQTKDSLNYIEIKKDVDYILEKAGINK